ncbi:PhzF family phenazine biosynthesis protein [Cyanobacterium sp. Dongsha4]|uniref:PhzF family phenazine biosynthesis protein n=1 Tax=Cyanobacterium sp. DS4 TaxID=2878255 RepID=UPI002E800AE4|nr:PhzF family phenazine biosynthesis protein [Cyanobacterium sp. Dongsha4]WVK99992.1 PhzF family phenazine biosynthesis protein [Cyanobacterium sp. Dongsha4]
MKYQFYTLDVFTNQSFTGNQLAVFPHSEGLSSDIMEKIAVEFNFSETVFVFPASNSQADYQVRIFTPGGEIPFAGHPTIGTAFLLAHLGMVTLKSSTTQIILEEKVGLVPVNIYTNNGIVTSSELTAPNPPEFFHDIPSKKALAEVLSLSEIDLHSYFSPQAVSCGLPFMIIPLNTQKALSEAKINLYYWEKTLKNTLFPHVYPCYPVSNNHWQVRMFAPALNIIEDPATGSAATAFAAYLTQYQQENDGSWQWLIEQGIEIGRNSKITAIATKQKGIIKDIKVKGECVIITEGYLHLKEKI